MFQDFSSPTIEFHSKWNVQKKSRDSTSQTSAILSNDVGAQTHKQQNVECQTISFDELVSNAGETFTLEDGNDGNLHKFLLQSEPLIVRQLQINIHSSGLYSSLLTNNHSSSGKSIICSYSLDESTITNIESEEDQSLEVTSVSWTSSGSSIVVGYGTNSSLPWCDQQSYICLWNLDRPSLDHMSSDQKVEVESSVQIVACHPQIPGYIAAGLYSGVVLVWKLVDDEVMYSDMSHSDPVTSLCWVQAQSSKYLQLLSTSTDGKIFLWRLKKSNSKSLNKESQFVLNTSNLPRKSGITGVGNIGITSLCPVRSEAGELDIGAITISNNFVVGCENGCVLKCYFGQKNNSNPVVFDYNRHSGPVYSIDWSPFHHHLFLTCATDQICRIYHSLQASALREFRPEISSGPSSSYYLYSAFWSVSNPTLFFVAGAGGKIEAVDVETSLCRASVEVHGKDGKITPINRILPNHKQPSVFVSGSKLVHLWQIGSNLVEGFQRDLKMKFINDLANEAIL